MSKKKQGEPPLKQEVKKVGESCRGSSRFTLNKARDDDDGKRYYARFDNYMQRKEVEARKKKIETTVSCQCNFLFLRSEKIRLIQS